MTAHKSKISGVGGIARIHADLLPHLKVEKGNNVEVISRVNKTAVILSITADSMVPKNTISLRPVDMEHLEIEEGAEVFLEAHATIGDVLGEWKDKVVAKFTSDKDEEDEEGDKNDSK